MYRSRTGDSLDKEVLKFLSSVHADSHLLHYDILGSEAHILMLHERGILSASNLQRLLVELERIRKNPKVMSVEGYKDIHECI